MKHSVLELLQLSTGYFEKRGVDNPRLCAEVLLARALGIERIQLYLRFDQPVAEPEVDAYRELTRRRGSGEPLQYILGEQEFWSLPFTVAPGVLIPRPETELLVEETKEWLGLQEAPRLLDLCTGSGCVAVALAHEVEGLQVVATDIDGRALEIAGQNAQRNEVAERVEFRRGDLFAAMAEENEGFDALTANPPYVTSAECETLMTEVRDHEPRHALDGGADGLNFVRRIVAEAPRHLRAMAVMALEVGAGQAPATLALVEADGRYEDARIREDYSGIERVVVARMPA